MRERRRAFRVADRLTALAGLSYRRAWLVLVLVALSVAVAMASASRLRLSADMSELLPPDMPSVLELDQMRERLGGVGYVAVVAHGAPAATLRRFAADMAPQLERLEGIRYVEYRRPLEFFRDRALYYLDVDQLRELDERVGERVRWEYQRRNPLMVSLDDEGPPSLELPDLQARLQGSAVRRLAGSGQDLYLDPAEGMVVLLCKPAGRASDLAFSQRIVERVEAFLAQQDLRTYDPNLRVSLTGTFKKKVDQQAQISRDLAISAASASVIMVLYLLLHFRSVVAVALVLLPMGVGVAWTYGFVGVAYGSVNLLTAFLGAVLGGLGTEHGIHLLSREVVLRAQGHDGLTSIRESFRHSGTSALMSAVVAAVTFSSLAISEFRAFREFGLIAAIGMLLMVAAYVVVLPALLRVLRRHGVNPSSARAVASRASRLASHPEGSRRIVWLTIPVLVGALLLLPRVAFDYDFSSLEDGRMPSYVLDRKVNRLLGHSQTPTVVFAADADERQALLEAVQRAHARRGASSTIDFAATLDALVPSRQEEKQTILRSLQRRLDKVDPAALSPRQRDGYDQLVRMAGAEPFALADVPTSITRQFASSGPGGFVFVFPRVSMSDGKMVQAFAEELRQATSVAGRPARVAGDSMILADIISLVRHDSAWVLLAAVGLVLLALWLGERSLKAAVLCLSPTLISIVCLVGWMVLSDTPFNFLNIVAVPVLIGTTVDAGVHLVGRLREASPDELGVALAQTGRAIGGGLFTSAVGFAALTMANHPGLRSLGTLTIVGFAINLLVMLLVFPALSMWRRQRRLVTQDARDEAVRRIA